jgi:Protein of unknown function (DUF1360)
MLTHGAWFLTCDALATYRLAILISRDKITATLRENSRRAAYTDNGSQRPGVWAAYERWIYELIICQWCVSVWLAAAVVALTRFAPDEWQYVAMALALSAVAGFLGDR